MLTQRVPALLGLFLVCFLTGLLPSRVLAQHGAPAVSIADLQLEVRRVRKRGDELRSEVKRQQQAVGRTRQELQALTARLGNREAEIARLQERTQWLSRWLLGLLAVSVAALLAGLLRRGGDAAEVAPLTIARERTGQIHEGLAALEARIQVIEQRSPGE
jgi:hypothetical protein